LFLPLSWSRIASTSQPEDLFFLDFVVCLSQMTALLTVCIFHAGFRSSLGRSIPRVLFFFHLLPFLISLNPCLPCPFSAFSSLNVALPMSSFVPHFFSTPLSSCYFHIFSGTAPLSRDPGRALFRRFFSSQILPFFSVVTSRDLMALPFPEMGFPLLSGRSPLLSYLAVYAHRFVCF